MPTKAHSELTAGLFVLLGLSALLAIVIWLGASDLLEPSAGQAVFYAPESSGSLGLISGGEVKVNDDVIGKIAGIRPDPEHHRTLYVVKLLRAGMTIYSDANARVSAGLVGGSSLILLDRGTPANPPADLAHPVAIRGGLEEAVADMAAAAKMLRQTLDRELDEHRKDSVLGMVKGILGDIDSASGQALAMLSSLQGQMDPNQQQGLLAKALASVEDVRAVTARLRQESDPNRTGAMIAKIHRSLDEIQTLIAESSPKVAKTLDAVSETAEMIRGYTRKDVAEILAQLRAASTDVLKTANSFAQTSESLQGLVDRNTVNIDETLDNLMLVSANLKATATDIRRKPWLLLYQPDQKEVDSENIKAAARAFVDGATQLDQAITKLKAMDTQSLQAADLKAVRDHIQRTFENFTKAEQALFKELSK